MSVVPPDSVVDPKIAFDHLDDLPLPGRSADSPRVDDDEITFPGHATSFLLRRFGVLGNGPGDYWGSRLRSVRHALIGRGLRREPDFPCHLPMLSDG